MKKESFRDRILVNSANVKQNFHECQSVRAALDGRESRSRPRIVLDVPPDLVMQRPVRFCSDGRISFSGMESDSSKS